MSQVRPIEEIIEDFLKEGPYAVVGASTHRHKYGNKVLRAYLQRNLPVYAVNPHAEEVEGLKSYASLAKLPEVPRGVSIITPPEVTEQIVVDAAEVGVRFLWMQPGAESPAAVQRTRDLGLEVIADGSCFLVVAGYRE